MSDSRVTFQGIGDPNERIINTKCRHCGKAIATRSPIIFCSVACYQDEYLEYVTEQEAKREASKRL